jgi:pimeloyl-ACP methyl ester carboxylesterase
MKRLLFVLFFLWMNVFQLSSVFAEFTIRGKTQDIHIYGTSGNPPIIVSSGDGGWFGFSVSVANFLAEQGYFVIGFNSKRYLESFTTKESTLKIADVSRDYQTLLDYSMQSNSTPPILVGISEGAGLSLLAATLPENKSKIKGLLLLGLPNENELAWKWSDFKIWFTHKTPNEPIFRADEVISKVSPVPFAEIHSTHDEFISLEDEKKIFALAQPPKKMWAIEAKNHRFSDNRETLEHNLLEALQWIQHQIR